MDTLFVEAIFFTLFFVLVLFALVSLAWRRWKNKRVNVLQSLPPSGKFKRILIHVLRLSGFTLLSFILVIGAVELFIFYQSFQQDFAPAPSRVEIPSGLSFPVEEVTFPGEGGLSLAGWYSPPKNGTTIILLHGYGSNRMSSIWHAGFLTGAGYGVLMYDERASGESGGDYRSYGWEDPADVGSALAYLDSRAGTDRYKIGISGCSIGGQIALQGAYYFPRIGAVWADAPSMITSRDMPPPSNLFLMLIYPPNLLMDYLLAARIHHPIPPAMIDIIGRIEPRPVMLVTGGRPTPLYGPESILTSTMFQHAGAHAQLWVIPEVTHCNGPVQVPDEYANKMLGFFDAAFGIER